MDISRELLLGKNAWRDQDVYSKVYEYSLSNPQKYWLAQSSRLDWIEKPTKAYRISNAKGFNQAVWFDDGKINVCYNCVDRHALKNPDKIALIWQSEDLEKSETYTYQQLKDEVCRFANTLKKLGLTKKNFVTIYMPMIPEAAFACLACARLGIPYSAVFAGFSANAISIRMEDSKSDFIITADGNRRGGKFIDLKKNIDETRTLITDRAVRALVVKRQNSDIHWDDSLDIDYYEVSNDVSTECELEINSANDPLFVLYTSGSVGKPKGVLLGSGGFLLFSGMTSKYFFELDDESIYWGAGDIGWMGGHSYALYGPLSNGVTMLWFEGMPTYPSPSIYFDLIDKYKVSSFYTAPTAIRALMKTPNEALATSSRDSLKLLGVMGEILDKETWYWYFNEVGRGKCPLINMWGQTELGGVSTAPLANLDEMTSYGHIGRQFFGSEMVLLDDQGTKITKPFVTGNMFLAHPLPGMLIDLLGGNFKETYYPHGPDLYWSGDQAYFDNEGYFWITGRQDDVLNVSGHRVSPIEIEEVIAQDEIVAEVSVVGFPHELKGEGIFAFVVLKNDLTKDQINNARKILETRVNKTISPITRPDRIEFVSELPKTRSGKIMRRILRKIASKDTEDFADITTLANPECLDILIKRV